MIRILRKAFKTFLLLIFIFLLVVLMWCGWQYIRNPVSALERGTSDLSVVRDSAYSVQLAAETRTYIDLSLCGKEVGLMRATVSLPKDLTEHDLPVLIVLGGLEIGRESLKYITKHGRNAVIAYEYPYSPRYWYDGTPLTQLPVIRESVLKVPAQVEALAGWAARQPWADEERVSVAGYSFGALFVPAVYHLCLEHKFYLGPGIIAYGGVNAFEILKNNLRFLSPASRWIVAWGAATAIRPAEPALHVPFMQPKFLIINGLQDNQIPESSWRKLQEMVLEPKTIVNLDAGHMNPGNPELTRQLVELSCKWLLKQGAIEE